MRVIVLIACFFLSVSAWAVPGVDTAQAIKQYYVLVKQLKELKKQVKQADEMISQGKNVVKDAEGHYGYGNLINTDKDKSQRDWAPDDWNDALHDLSGGNSARYQELLKDFQKEHPTLSGKQYAKGASQSLVRSYKNNVQMNRTATLQADQEYNHIKSLLQNVDQLRNKIEQAPNTKAAMDLNSRLLAELSYISAEGLRMQTLMNHQIAATSAEEIDAKSREAIFNKLPMEKP